VMRCTRQSAIAESLSDSSKSCCLLRGRYQALAKIFRKLDLQECAD
jgi:hypothetical protein